MISLFTAGITPHPWRFAIAASNPGGFIPSTFSYQDIDQVMDVHRFSNCMFNPCPIKKKTVPFSFRLRISTVFSCVESLVAESKKPTNRTPPPLTPGLPQGSDEAFVKALVGQRLFLARKYLQPGSGAIKTKRLLEDDLLNVCWSLGIVWNLKIRDIWWTICCLHEHSLEIEDSFLFHGRGEDPHVTLGYIRIH